MPWKNITKVQQRDTCLALTFLLLLIWLFTKQTAFVYAAMGLLLLGMLIPAAMSPWPGFGSAFPTLWAKSLPQSC